MSRRSRNAVRIVISLAAIASVWLVSSEPWGLGVEQLLMFAAPGALLGLGASWAAHASTQRQWTWKSSRRAALVGAIALPPVLAFVVAWDGNARPQRLLVGFVYAAWLVLIAGGVFALVRQPTTGR
jgi:peptidoglycan/LPS O-acetylase OafA/YrhL